MNFYLLNSNIIVVMKVIKTEIYLLNLKNRLERPVDEYLKFFSHERVEKIIRYKFNADRNRTIFAELLARELIAERTGKNFEEIKISRDENGRPFCEEYPKIFFSLSHSGIYVACSVGDLPNGVDVENIGRKIDINIAKRFFLPNEYESLNSIKNEDERTKKFFEFWTLKEAALKCFRLNDWSGVDCGKLILEKRGKNFFVENYVIGVCTENGILPDKVKNLLLTK